MAGTISRWDKCVAAVDVAFLVWVGSWGCAMAVHGAHYGDAAGMIGAMGFLVGLVVALVLAATCYALLRGKPWRWWSQGVACVWLGWWYFAWFSQMHWKIW